MEKTKKILIDLMKFRELGKDMILVEYYENKKDRGIRNLIEAALFTITCRKCQDSPCINVCPQDALEKDKNDLVKRNNNLCVGCKSCSIACPFGTIPTNIVDYVISKDNFLNVSKDTELEKMMKKYPGVIEFTDKKPSEEDHIYQVTDNVYVKDFKWEEFIK